MMNVNTIVTDGMKNNGNDKDSKETNESSHTHLHRSTAILSVDSFTHCQHFTHCR